MFENPLAKRAAIAAVVGRRSVFPCRSWGPCSGAVYGFFTAKR